MSEKTFTYLINYLATVIGPEYVAADIAKFTRASKFSMLTASRLSDLVEKCVYGSRDKLFMADDDGVLFVFNGEYFEKVDNENFLEVLIERVFRALSVGLLYVKYCPAKIAQQCIKHLRNSEACRFVPDRRYICFTNGVLDLKDRKLKNFGLRYTTDIVLDFPYNERASCVLWDIKVKEIIPNDDFRRAFQEFCGALLVKRDEVKVEDICYLVGSGSNGKSVVSQAVANVFGEDYYSTFTPKQLFKEGSSSMFNMYELRGKLLNVVDDLSNDDFSGGEFKRFISGEKFKARGVHQRKYVMIQPPLMLCCTNEMPDTTDDSDGHHRRQLPIQTTATQFIGPMCDPCLTAKLSTVEARQRIFNWILEGYKKLMSNGGKIELSEHVKKALEEYKADSTPMRRWYRDGNYVALPEKEKWDPRWRPLKEVFAEYEAYCDENGYPKCTDSRKLSRLLRSQGCLVSHNRNGTIVLIGRWGIDTEPVGGEIEEDKQTDNNEKQ